MKQKYFFFPLIKYLFIFILLKIIKNLSLFFHYPTAITLNNGNIIIIHKTGISICDPSLSYIVRSVKNFSTESEQISDSEKLSKVAIAKFDDDYVVSIINDKIYIIDKNGYLKINGYSLNTNDILYYSLAIHKYNIDYYYYLIGYLYQNKLYLYYYKYSPSENKNIEAAKIKDFYIEESYGELFQQNKGLSCQFLKSSSEDLILCLFHLFNDYFISNELLYSSFYINEKLIKNKANEYDIFDYSIECIKSSVNSDHSKALFCYYLFNREVRCEKISFIRRNDSYYYNNKSLQKINGFKVDYFEEKKEFMFSYFIKNGGIQIDI